MNKQSNVYTLLYIVVLVVAVGAALAFTAMSLKSRQQANADADKMRQILMAVHLVADSDVKSLYDKTITDSYIVNSKGDKEAGDAFSVDIKAQTKLPDSERKLPVYVCTLPDGSAKYILPVYGAGLWGPIWGYVAVDANGSKIYGAYFSHESETPGLGAEIAKPAFYDQFNPEAKDSKTLNLFTDNGFLPIEVVKNGQKPADGADYVNGVSGGTITSKGVSAMLADCLTPYQTFLSTLSTK